MQIIFWYNLQDFPLNNDTSDFYFLKSSNKFPPISKQYKKIIAIFQSVVKLTIKKSNIRNKQDSNSSD